jgi:hypothetical protein
VNHIALRVDSLDALRAAKARLEAAGIEVVGITDHHIIESIYFFDPNGIRLELTVPTASAETTARHEQEAHATVEAWTKGRSAPGSRRTTARRAGRGPPSRNYGAMDALRRRCRQRNDALDRVGGTGDVDTIEIVVVADAG